MYACMFMVYLSSIKLKSPSLPPSLSSLPFSPSLRPSPMLYHVLFVPLLPLEVIWLYTLMAALLSSSLTTVSSNAISFGKWLITNALQSPVTSQHRDMVGKGWWEGMVGKGWCNLMPALKQTPPLLLITSRTTPTCSPGTHV